MACDMMDLYGKIIVANDSHFGDNSFCMRQCHCHQIAGCNRTAESSTRQVFPVNQTHSLRDEKNIGNHISYVAINDINLPPYNMDPTLLSSKFRFSSDPLSSVAISIQDWQKNWCPFFQFSRNKQKLKMFLLKQKMIEQEMQNRLLVLKYFIGKLQAHFQLSHFKRPDFPHSLLQVGEDLEEQAKVPEDVKEGHFAVFAAETEKPQRFIVELQFLTDPAFLSLLKQAEEEYGFTQKGVLAVPCRPEELQKILQHKAGKQSPAGEYNTHIHWKL